MATPRRRFYCDDDLACLGYDGLNADADLERWREGRLNPATRELIEIIRSQGVEGARLLDIGAGVGAVHVALLEAGAASAVDVDASREVLATAQAEAERRGLEGRVEYRYGDIVELADELPPADIVTLDSVVCCYPYLEPMLAAATRSAPPPGRHHLPTRRVVDAGLHAPLQPGAGGAAQPRALLSSTGMRSSSAG